MSRLASFLLFTLFTAFAASLTVRADDNAALQSGKAKSRQFALMVGDRAPALSVQKWVRGNSVERFQEDHVYVVEFWATWCGPCLAGMPHLSALQDRYGARGVHIIGVTSEDPYGNSLQAVQALVKRKAGYITYAIGWDSPSESKKAYMGVFKGITTERYLKDAGIMAIPCAFVVDGQGRLAYIGNPLTLDDVLEKVIAGRWNLAAAAATYKKAREAEALLDSYQSLLKTGKYDEAYALGRRLLTGPVKDDFRGLLILATSIVDPEYKTSHKDTDLALAAATRANQLTHDEDPGALSTLARVYWVKGEGTKAVELQEKAVNRAEGPYKNVLQKTLDEFNKKATKGAQG